MHIVDRRLNPGGKSFANRQRFLRRAKEQVQRAVRDTAKTRDIRGVDQAGEVEILTDGIAEPNLRRQGAGGKHDYILPGNRNYSEGDTIERPRAGKGRGSGAGDGGAPQEDKFRFVLTREEFLNIFLDDLELPDLAKRRLSVTETQGMRRAGYTVSGSPANIALTRTMQNALARRIALKRPKAHEVAALAAEVEALDEGSAERHEKAATLEAMRRRAAQLPYLDPFDLRYRRFEPFPKPIAQAVMFCVMDVSGSMTEHMKDLAKRFFMLMHVFLTRRYRHVDIVFIRHTDKAMEVDEETFFSSAETGGTLVSSALVEMKRVIAERYSPSDWNIYGLQASDGDNSSTDAERVRGLLQEGLLPDCQYYAYLEVGEEGGVRLGPSSQGTTLWRTYKAVSAGNRFAMRRVNQRGEIYPVFRDLFGKQDAGGASRSEA